MDDFEKLGGGSHPPPMANKMIRTAVPYGDDMMLSVLLQAWIALKNGGVEGGAAPPLCKHNDPQNLALLQTL